MVAKGKVRIWLQLLSLINLITALIGFAHISKLKNGSIIIVISIVIGVLPQSFLPFPHGLITALVIVYSIPIPFMYKWAKEWNEKINSQSATTL